MKFSNKFTHKKSAHFLYLKKMNQIGTNGITIFLLIIIKGRRVQYRHMKLMSTCIHTVHTVAVLVIHHTMHTCQCHLVTTERGKFSDNFFTINGGAAFFCD